MEPLISIIIPVYKVEKYLRQCLDSVLNQTYKHIEIIVVDDGSPDTCPAICDEYAKRDTRVKVIHKKNGGLSEARNVGIEAASGEYIGFVDSDDWIATDMYEYLYNGIRTYDADISVCEYYECFSQKRTATYRDKTRLFFGDEAIHALLQLKFGNYAWNKLYKRSLWDGDIRYPVGRKYEDVLTTYRLVEQCSLVVALPTPKYFYRRSDESITGTRTIPNDVERVKSHLDRFSVLKDRYEAERGNMIKIIFENCLLLRDTIYMRSDSEYNDYLGDLDSIQGFITEHLQEIYSIFHFGRTGRFATKLMGKGGRRGWILSKRIISLRETRLAKLLKKSIKIKSTLQSKFKSYSAVSYYYKSINRPIKDTVFIESRGGKDFAGNMFFIAKEACSRGMKVYLSVAKNYNEKVANIISTGKFDGLTIVEKKSKEYYYAFATSKYLFNDMVYEDYFIKRKEQIYVNTWHGTPLKHLEHDVIKQRHELGGAARDFLKSDYLAVPSVYLFEKLLSSNHIHALYQGKALFSGYPRNSVFFDMNMRKHVRDELGIDKLHVFVYMPTWRGTWSSHIDTTGEYSTEEILAFFDTTLKENQILYVKLHNFSTSTIDFSKYRKVQPFPQEFDTYAVLNSADCLITDYSSVLFDFANTRRKVLLFAYDLDDYLKVRGLYIDIGTLPFPIVSTYEELEKELNVEIHYDDSAFLKEYCTFDCIDSAQQIFKQIVDGDETCNTLSIDQSGKKNCFIYDTNLGIRTEEVVDVVTALQGADSKYSNYYCYRQWLLKKTPKYLQNMSTSINLFTIPYKPFALIWERAVLKLFARAPRSMIERESSRLFFGKPFDKVFLIGDNRWDPYYPIFSQLEKETL